MEQKKPPEKQVVAQPKPAPPPVGEAGEPATLAGKLLPCRGRGGQAAPAAAAEGTQTAALQEQVEELKEQVGQVAEAQKQEFLSKYNPSIGFVGETLFDLSQPARPSIRLSSPREPSPRPGGCDFFQRSMELNIAGSVDPFARGYAVLNASADPVTGEATVGVEEAAIVTTSLPWNLTVKAGRFFGEFGRLSYIHDHELPFVWRPLALDSYIGGESRTDGVQVNWLLPLSHYVSLTAGVGDSFGGQPNNFGDFQTENSPGLTFGAASPRILT